MSFEGHRRARMGRRLHSWCFRPTSSLAPRDEVPLAEREEYEVQLFAIYKVTMAIENLGCDDETA
jgi:hypothetical protein